MTDLEIVKKCAEKMGYDKHQWQTGGIVTGSDLPILFPDGLVRYDPLHDDAQAMALIRKYASEIRRDENGDWSVKINRTRSAPGACAYRQPDLNRAICECVANLPEEK